MSDPTFVSLVHLGCARNLIDSELILGRMGEQGLVVTDDPSTAHTVVVNTCSFIGPAQIESENAIKDLLERKARGEIQGVVVAGCLVQRYRRKLQERFPQVDFFAEISDYSDLARRVREHALAAQCFDQTVVAAGLELAAPAGEAEVELQEAVGRG